MNDDTTKTLTAYDILSMAGVKRPSEMQDKNAGLLKLADSIYESDLLKELRKDRERLDWIQANWSRCGFISVGEFPIGEMREEIDAEMKRPKGEANSDYGLDCPVCGEPIIEPQATDHTEDGLAHAACCVPMEEVKRPIEPAPEVKTTLEDMRRLGFGYRS